MSKARRVFVQWHNVAVEDELELTEVGSTGTFQKTVPHHARVVDGSGDSNSSRSTMTTRRTRRRCPARQWQDAAANRYSFRHV